LLSSPAAPTAPAAASVLNDHAAQVAAAKATPRPPAVDAKPPVAAKPPAPKAKQEAAAQDQATGISALATKPEDLQRIYGNMMPPAADPFEGRVRNIGEMEKANAEKDLAQRRKDIEELGVAFTDREAKLKDRQGRVGKQEERLPYMALMEAGLAMMSGTSPNAFTNIGAGGAAGLKSYQQGVEKISDAKDKLDDAFGRIEEARRGEKVLNAKELGALEANVRKTVIQAEKDVLTGAQQAYGLANAQAGKMFEAYVANKRSEYEQDRATERSNFEQKQATERTRITAGAPTGLERILSSPTLFPKYMQSQTGAANVRSEAQARKEYAENPAIRQMYPNIQDYLSIVGGTGAGGADDGLKFLGSKPTQ
jgi:hypothetical protein